MVRSAASRTFWGDSGGQVVAAAATGGGQKPRDEGGSYLVLEGREGARHGTLQRSLPRTDRRRNATGFSEFVWGHVRTRLRVTVGFYEQWRCTFAKNPLERGR